MKGFRRARPQALSRGASLVSRPMRNPALKAERREDGTVLLRVPPNPSRWARLLARLLRLKDMERRISLDELGTAVWDMCDGETTVRTMVERFRRTHQLNAKEAEVSMVAYLRTLAKKSLIGIIVPENVGKKS